MDARKFQFSLVIWAALFILAGSAVSIALEDPPKDLPILQTWSGDYPVSELHRLPPGQQESRVGYLGDTDIFTAVWQAFKPEDSVPDVDFTENLVIFSRNVDFYNRTSIVKVTLRNGSAEVIAIETKSALPIEDRVAVALAVIPRAGVKFIKAGKEMIPLATGGLATDPLNAAYVVGRRSIKLSDGRSEIVEAPGSATRTKISVFGKPVYGDIDGDGEEDTALLLVEDPGGSGTFYYVAASINLDGAYRGTNAVLLGDRIAPQNVRIRNGVIFANYADRQEGEPMASRPSVGKSKYLTLREGALVEIKPLGEGEQVLEGWITIGHEVRSFRPCPGKPDLWLTGSSPALKEIMAGYWDALPDKKPYTPLFMTLAGKFDASPAEGFGAEYESGFWATQLVQVWPKGNCKSDLIVVDAPVPGALVLSPLRVQGRARGFWFFEGDFPMVLLDSRGKVIGKGYCSAKSEWMTREFVAFEGSIEFKRPGHGESGTLILKKDNPSDLREHDDELALPVLFR